MSVSSRPSDRVLRVAGVGRDKSSASLVLFAFAISGAWSAMALLRLRALYGLGFDLGFYQQQVWLLSRGLSGGSLANLPMFADHLSPVLVLFTPLAESSTLRFVMVVLQAGAIGIAVVQLGRAIDRKGSFGQYWWILAYVVLSPVVGFSLLFDFHPSVLGIPVVIAALNMTERAAGQPALIAVMLGASMIREDVALLVAIIVMLHERGRSWRRLSKWVAASVSLGVSVYVLFGSAFLIGYAGHPIQERYSWVREAMGGLSKIEPTRIVNAYSLVTVLILFVPVLIFPTLLRHRAVILALVVSAVQILAEFAPADSIYYQHHILSVVLVAWAMVTNPVALDRTKIVERGKAVAILSLVSALLLGPIGLLAPPVAVWDRWIPFVVGQQDRRHMADVASLVPSDASVSASSTLVPLFAQRQHVYGFPDPLTCSARFTPSRGASSYPDFVALDMDRGEREVDLVTTLGYRRVGSAGGAVLFRAPTVLPKSIECEALSSRNVARLRSDATAVAGS